MRDKYAGHLWRFGLLLYLAMLTFHASGYIRPLSRYQRALFEQMEWAAPGLGTALLRADFSGQLTVVAALVAFAAIMQIRLLHVGSGEPWRAPAGVDRAALATVGILATVLLAGKSVQLLQNKTAVTAVVLADLLTTPPHIVPDWYSLPFYSMVRSIPAKNSDILWLIAFSFLFPMILPFRPHANDTDTKSMTFVSALFWLFVAEVGVLGYLGTVAMEGPALIMARLLAGFYFVHVFVVLPWLAFFWRRTK